MTIGIIEDDTLLHQALKTALQNAGYQTVSAYTKQEALTTITGSESLLLIDIGLPDGNGLACYKKIRENTEIPAIFLTARDEETDMLTAFDTGADDYVVKPFSMKVLLKRIEAVIGRNNREKQLACGEIILFPDKKQVYKNEKEIILTAREYQLLEYLMYNQGNVLTKENILEYVWGLDGQFVVDNTVSVTINRLRKKIETDAGSPIYVYQGKCRQKELKLLAECMEKILREEKIRETKAGEETLYARLESRLVRIQEMLNGRTEAAEKSKDEIQKLISEIAHQMRTPLANIRTYQELLEEEWSKTRTKTDENVDNYLNAMRSGEQQLEFLTEGFVKMSRLEQNMIQVRKEETDLLKTVRNCLGRIQKRAEEKQIAFRIELPQEVNCPHDANWIGEAIDNVLDNAVKYSRPGGIIEMRIQKNEMHAKITVKDNGLGIEKGEEHKIFQRFYRGKNVTTQKGYGIGLYLARKIIGLHGGFMIAKNRYSEKGLMIEINLPVC